MDWVYALLLGAVGGVVRVFWTGVINLPRLKLDEWKIYLGSFSTVSVGAVAGLVAWGLTTQEIFVERDFGTKAVIATLLAGIAGSNVLLSVISNFYGTDISEDAGEDTGALQDFAQKVGSATQDQAGALNSLSDELTRCNNKVDQLETQNTQLRAEVERLKGDPQESSSERE